MRIIAMYLLSSILTIHLATGQILKPVKWSFSTNKLNDNEVELVLTAKIDHNWYLYSQDVPKGGPIPTSFKFNPSPNYELIDKVAEQKPEIKQDDNFDMKLKVFHKSATFKQKVKILSAKDFVIDGSLEFMCCNNMQCLPPDEVEFKFGLKGSPQSAASNQQPAASQQEKQNKQNGENIVQPDNQSNNQTNQQKDKSTNQQIIKPANQENNSSLWSFFFFAFLAGLAGILTPCVFPMIPMTVTFFINSKSKKGSSIISAIIYGLSIIVIYTAIGLIVSLLKSDPDTINRISTHWLTNMIFFTLFVVFAASFFGMFELVLPSGMITKVDKQVDKGGYVAAFFMALTLVLVSFACTGPIVGSILIEATTGHVLKPVIGMFGFGFAFAIPFVVLALFPSLLSNLPKSGGWLNSVKVVMAFIILAFSLKFFVSADQSYHWNILSREGFLAIWIVLFTLLGFYLLGKLKFKLDSALPYVSFPRILLAIATFAFVVYMIPGLFGAQLKLVGGFLPPASSNSFNLSNLATSNQQPASSNQNSLCETAKYSNILQLPYNLQGYFDYSQGLACARKMNKPIFIAFTGHSCGNCHKMENDVWSNPEVLKRLREDYIVIMLYTDDRTDLPQAEWVTSLYDGKVKKTMGAVNADFRITRYKANIQPFYVLLGTDEKLLTDTRAYDTDVEGYVKFLDEGIKQFKIQSSKFKV